jgi:hypothetical protein
MNGTHDARWAGPAQRAALILINAAAANFRSHED